MGRLHVYYGDGKGKTSAAVGLCIRAAGHGLRVGIAQFLKPGTSGELTVLRKLDNVTVFPHLPNVKFVNAMTAEERIACTAFCAGLMREIETVAPQLDVLLLDEAGSAAETGMLDMAALTAWLNARPAGLEVIVTAHNPPAALIDMADYVTELRCERHPYQTGAAPKKGIEW